MLHSHKSSHARPIASLDKETLGPDADGKASDLERDQLGLVASRRLMTDVSEKCTPDAS